MGYLGKQITITGTQNSKRLSVLATDGQTTFTVSNGYTIGQLDVYRNGVKLSRSRDFTASDGTSVVLVSAASANDIVEFVVFENFDVANAITTGGNQTITGDLTVEGDFTAGTALTVTNGGVTAGILTAQSFHGDGANLTNVGVDTAQVSTSGLVVSGISTFSDAIRVGSAVTILTDGSANFGTQGTSGIVTFNNNVHLDGCDIEFQSQGDQLKFSTAASNPASGGCIEIKTTATTAAKISGNSSQFKVHVDDNASQSFDLRAATYTIQDDNAEYYALFYQGQVRLHHATAHGGIGEQKFETDPGGVKITGVCTATSFSGSGSGLTGLNIPAGFNELDAALFN